MNAHRLSNDRATLRTYRVAHQSRQAGTFEQGATKVNIVYGTIDSLQLQPASTDNNYTNLFFHIIHLEVVVKHLASSSISTYIVGDENVIKHDPSRRRRYQYQHPS
jgi:hypothetical protein